MHPVLGPHRIAAALAAIVVVLAPQLADAIPRFSVRTGATCATCHVNPSGGGMRNAYGRNVFGPTRLPLRGSDDTPTSRLADLEFADSFAFGADLRTAAIAQIPEAGPNAFTWFLMQADGYFAATPTPYLTFYMDLGFYGSSEAMAILRHGSGLYVKAGRFMPSYGLRLENHNVFIRESLGFGPRQKDTGVEIGFARGGFHLQAAALNGASKPETLLDENWQKALLGRAEWIRPGTLLNLMLGASGSYNISGTTAAGTDTRVGQGRVGAFAGASLGRLTYLAEADVEMTRAFADYKWTRRYLSYQELDLLIARGLELACNWEYLDPDLRYGDNAYHRGTVGFELHPVPNVELKVFHRYVWGPSDNPLVGLHETFAMLHLYL